MNNRAIENFAGVIGAVAISAFGVQVLLMKSVEGLSFTSFLSWTAMDAMCLYLAWKRNESTALFLGWTLSAVFATTCLYYKGAPGSFGAVESVAVTTVMISMFGMLRGSTKVGVIACAVGMFVAGIPQLVSIMSTGDTSTWWLWAVSAVAGLMTLRASEKVLPSATLLSSQA